MIKAIMAIDEKGGVSKNGSMPWPKNSADLKWFKENTKNNVVIMGRLTWADPFMPTPLKNRINVLITKQDKSFFPGADEYISGNLIDNIEAISNKFLKLEKFIIGGPKILDQVFEILDEFYITRIYGNYECDNFLDINKIEKNMILQKKIESDSSCHFEIWKK